MLHDCRHGRQTGALQQQFPRARGSSVCRPRHAGIQQDEAQQKSDQCRQHAETEPQARHRLALVRRVDGVG